MSSGIPIRKRDHLRRLLGRPAKDLQPSGSATPAPSFPTPSIKPLPQTNDLSRGLLQDALKGLKDEERSLLQGYITHDVGDTIRAAHDAAERQWATCEQEKWIGSDKASRIVLWLDRFKAVGDIAVNADPIHAGLPWAGIRILLEVVVADSNQMAALVSGMDLALQFANLLQAYFAYLEHLPPNSTTEHFRGTLVKLYAHLLHFLAIAIQTYDSNRAVRKLRALWQVSDINAFKDQCDKLGQRAEIAATNCDRDLHAKEWAEASHSREQLETRLQELNGIIKSVAKSLDVSHVNSNRSKLSTVREALYNSSAEQKLSVCLEGTRTEILQDIEQWADKPDGKLIFWLCGKAGTGKSTISRTIARRFDKAQRLDNRPCLGATFFFKRGEQGRSNADYFFSTIAAQLSDIIPHMRVPMSEALDKYPDLCRDGIQPQFENLLLQPLLSIDSAHLPPQRLVIVIDALDECDRDMDIIWFLRLLCQLEAKSALQLRIFLTSRPDFPVQLGIGELDKSFHQDIFLEEVQRTSIRQDILAYFNAEFANIKKNRLLIRPKDALPPDWPSEDDVQALVDMASPLFIFASTVCRFISESNPQKRLQLMLEQRYRAGSSRLAKTYLPVLDQLLLGMEGDEPEEILTRFHDVVGAIILAAEPLSIASLSSLLNIDQQDINCDLLDLLHSVLQVPSESHVPVRLLHLSFRDFLIDAKRKDGKRFWVNKAETHKKLAMHCLRRLNEPGILRNDICSVQKPGIRRSQITENQIAIHIPPDVYYACCYWPWHLINSGERLQDNDQVHRFLQQHFLHWLETSSWLGRLSDILAHVRDLLSIAQGPGSEEIASFLQDAGRFVLQYRYIIDLAPLQVYHSALIFAPMMSVVRNSFYNDAPKLWQCFSNIPLHWNAERYKLEGHGGGVLAVAFSPDGQLIASASGDSTVRVWNVQTGEQIQMPEGHRDKVHALAFSSDGQLIASGSYDKTVRVWNAQTGEQIHILVGHKSEVCAVAFSPDGQLIASASYNTTVRVWNVQRGKTIQLIPTFVNRIVFSADGKSLKTRSEDVDLHYTPDSTRIITSTQTSSLTRKGDWIRNRDEDLLWLPHGYRGPCTETHGQTLVLGQQTGAVTILRLL